MAIIGSADLLVTPRLAPGFAGQLRQQVSQASATVQQSGQAFVVTPKVDTEPLRQATQRSGSFFQRFQKDADASLSKVGLSIRSLSVAFGAGFLAGDVLALALRGLVSSISGAVTNASNLNEAVSASEVIFGSASGAIQQFGDTAADKIGLSERAAIQAANSFGLLFTSADATQAAAANLSVALVSLASDIASLQNVVGGAEEVSQAFRSALVGEAEPVRRFGIDVRVAAIEALALREGVIQTGEAISSQGATFLRTAAIIEQSQVAAGDYTRTQRELANAIRAARAAEEEASTSLGENLSKAALRVQDIRTGLAEARGAVFRGFPEFAQSLPVVGSLIGSLERVGQNARKGADGVAVIERNLAAAKEQALQLARISQQLVLLQPGGQDARLAAIQQIPGALLSVAQAELGIAQAQQGVISATQRINDLRREQASQASKIAEAEFALERAHIASARASFDLARAEFETADIRSGVDREERWIDVTLRVAEAQLKLTDQMERQRDIALDLRNAQFDLLRSQFAYIGVTRQRRASDLQLAGASLDIANAEEKIRDIQREGGREPLDRRRAEIDLAQALREQSRFNEEQTFRERDAAFRLEDARFAVRAAGVSLRQADERLQEAHRRTREISDDLRAAHLALRSANLQVAVAVDGHAQATVRLRVAEADAKGEAFGLNEQIRLYADTVGPRSVSFIDNVMIPALDRLSAKLRADVAAAQQALNQLTGDADTGIGGTSVVPIGTNASGTVYGFPGQTMDGARESESGWVRIGKEIASGFVRWLTEKGLNPFSRQFGGDLFTGNIPGAQFGLSNIRSRLVTVGEAGPEILRLSPSGRADVIPHGRTADEAREPTIINVYESATPLATARAVDYRIGERSRR